mmetsp:Transcript_17214/g.41070  ORF Transcript_17214/g.41070 Transcript_17214/m.41070 type:complete len:212 (+) Transcript_17214:767-1402(+)
MLTALIRHISELRNSNWALTVVQVTAVVAHFSYALRPFRLQVLWCTNMASLLGRVLLSDRMEIYSIFNADEDIFSARFSLGSSWFLKQVVLPYYTHWSSLVSGSHCPQLCQLIANSARNYEVLCDTRIVNTDSSVALKRKHGGLLSLKPFAFLKPEYNYENPDVIMSICSLYRVPVLEECYVCSLRTIDFLIQDTTYRRLRSSEDFKTHQF